MTRCMLVEKSSVVRKVAKRILAAENRFVVDAETIDEALRLCSAQMPDVIVVESNPSGGELEDFVQAVRAMQGDIKPKIIIAMIELDLVVMTRAKRAGADDYLLKPFDRNLLLARFEELEREAA